MMMNHSYQSIQLNYSILVLNHNDYYSILFFYFLHLFYLSSTIIDRKENSSFLDSFQTVKMDWMMMMIISHMIAIFLNYTSFHFYFPSVISLFSFLLFIFPINLDLFLFMLFVVSIDIRYEEEEKQRKNFDIVNIYVLFSFRLDY
jgi:hypothetical protein